MYVFLVRQDLSRVLCTDSLRVRAIGASFNCFMSTICGAGEQQREEGRGEEIKNI